MLFRSREKIGDDKVVLGLSVGVDSTVAAVLLHRAIGENLHCIFVDSGLLRKNEFEDVLESYKNMGLNVKGLKAGAKFLGDLAGLSDPDRKRKLLLHRKQIRYLEQKTREAGLAIVPIGIYFSTNGLVKLEIALARGKKLHDKRQAMAERDSKREIARALKMRSR